MVIAVAYDLAALEGAWMRPFDRFDLRDDEMHSLHGSMAF